MTDDSVKADIHRVAAAKAEATVYSMTNPYLTAHEKARVEAIYQFPFGIFTYVFAHYALVGHQTFWVSYGAATFAGIVAWLFCQSMPRTKLIWWAGFVLAGWGGTIIQLAIAIYALFQRRWGVAAFVGLEAFGIMTMFMAPMWAWTIFNGRRMNPKYVIAKKLFGTVFPFETQL